MNRPSRDHWFTIFTLSFVNNDSSCAFPLAAFTKRLKIPLFRLEANAIRSPLGDQNGVAFVDASLVRRVSVPRIKSRTHRSKNEAPFKRWKATDFSSGEIAGRVPAPGAPTVLSSFPLRS